MHCAGTQPGIGGAPKLGDKVAWKPRIKQGEAVLTSHAIKGFKTPGSTGMAMMPKAGKPTLSDADIANAVAFLVSDVSRNITGQCLQVDSGMIMQ